MEILLEMSTGGARRSVDEFGGAFDKMTAKVVREANQIDAALGDIRGMDSLSRSALKAEQQLKKTASEVREFNRSERAGEALTAQLERQIAIYGKTTSDIRAMKAETAAANAERHNQVELAERIRAKEAELFAMEYSSARRARQEEEAAADARAGNVAARELETRSMRDAAAAHALFEAKVRQGAAALREQEAAEKAANREAAAAKLRAEAKAASDLADARDRLARILRESHDAQEADAAAAERLRAATDPLYAVTQRLNAEIAESTRLYHVGATAPAEYARQQEVLAQRLRDVDKAVLLSTTSLTGVGGSAKLAGHHTQNLMFQFQDLGVQMAAAAGSSDPLKMAMMALFQQGTQISGIMTQAGIGMRGLGAAAWALIAPFAPLIAVLAAAYGAFRLITSAIENDAGLKNYAKSLGLTKDEMAKLKDVGITTGDVMVGIWRTLDQDKSLSNFIKRAKAWFAELRDTIVSGMRVAGATIYGALVGGYRASIETWRQWPAAFADFFVQGVNKALDGINWLARGVNTLLGKDVLGQIGHLQNDYAGAGQKVGQAYSKAFAAAFQEGDAIIGLVGRNIVKAAQDRLSKQADELIADRTDKAAKKAKAVKEEFEKFRDPLGFLKDGNEPIKVEFDLDLPGVGFDVFDTLMEKTEKLNAKLQEAAGLFAEAWGPVGDTIGRAVTAVAQFGIEQAKVDQEHRLAIARAKTEEEAGRQNAEYSRRSMELQIGLYGDLAGAAKGFFDRGSAGYKALADAEKVFRAVQFALSVRAMAQDFAETATSIANSAARTGAGAVEAVVNAIKSLPFPLNLAAGAATVGALASLGVSIAGSFGGKGSVTPANDGTGTVLGDTSAKSDSLQRSIDLLGDLEHSTMVYSGQMLTALRSIDSKIGGFASLIARTGNVDASAGVDAGFKTDATGKALGFLAGGGVLGSLLKDVPIIGDILGGLSGIVKSLFGTKTKVVGSGLYGDAQALGDILSGGFDAQYYSDVEKKKKFFGVTTSTKVSTQYGDADPELANQFTLILRSFADAVLASAGPLGIATDAIESRLNGFVVSIGKIDLQGLTGEQVQEKLEAVFGAAADSIAAAAIPGLERFQKVGEGYFETLIRVASTAEAVTDALDMLGQGTRALGLDAKLGLADLFDSVSDMQAGIGSYFETFYTDAEQITARTAQLTRVFGGLGLTLPDTIAGYRSLVDAQDLNTEAGRAAYAALIKLAPAFADIATSAQDATSAAAIVREQQDLQKQLAEALGDTAAIRAAELARLDPSNRALQQQIWAIQDAQEAAKAADQLREAWKGVGDSIMDEVKRIRGLTNGAGGGGFASLLGQFNAANSAARGGDMDAAKNLPQLSKQLLDAAALAATSRQELDRVQGQTAATLEATFAAIAGFGADADGPSTSTLANLAASQVATSGSTAGGIDGATELRKEVGTLRAELVSALAQIASNTGRLARKLDDVTARSGGDAISVANAA